MWSTFSSEIGLDQKAYSSAKTHLYEGDKVSKTVPDRLCAIEERLAFEAIQIRSTGGEVKSSVFSER